MIKRDSLGGNCTVNGCNPPTVSKLLAKKMGFSYRILCGGGQKWALSGPKRVLGGIKWALGGPKMSIRDRSGFLVVFIGKVKTGRTFLV